MFSDRNIWISHVHVRSSHKTHNSFFAINNFVNSAERAARDILCWHIAIFQVNREETAVSLPLLSEAPAGGGQVYHLLDKWYSLELR